MSYLGDFDQAVTMNIRQFAQLCQRAAEGRDCTALLPTGQDARVALARMAQDHRVLPLLAAAMEQSGANGIPALQTARQYTARNMRIKAQLLELDRDLQGTGHRAILIKGAVQLFTPIYPDIGMRHMADIDILVLDPAFAQQLPLLGYLPKDMAYQDKRDGKGVPVLQHGGWHLTPMIRPKDLVTIEPHLLATSPIVSHLLPADVTTAVISIPGCNTLMQPSRQNHLIISLIHMLKHDRDTLDGALLVRGLVECEILYTRLTATEQAAVAAHFASCGAASLFGAWRALADWLFLADDAAQKRSLAAFLLITEFRLRARGYRMVFAIALLHRLFALANVRYWTSLTFVSHAGRFVRKDFWLRFFDRFRKAYRG
jgi:Uncharacterised nucleotidyltransferase